jgi:hypothetical protein
MALMRLMVVIISLAFVSPVPAIADPQQPAAENSPALSGTASPPLGFLVEPDAVRRSAIFADRHFSKGEVGEGWYPDLWSMIPGAGWVGGGPGYRKWYRHDAALFDASLGISWRGYKTAQARFELPKLAHSRLAAGAQLRWQDFTQITFYGEGPDAGESSRSEYRLRSTNLVGYGMFRPVKWVGIGAKIGWLTPSILPRAGSFLRDLPNVRQVFPRDIVFAVADQPSFVHSEASVTADTRDFPGHPTRGMLLRTAAANYADRDAGIFSFKRYEAEAAHFVPLADSHLVLAVHGWLVASDTDQGRVVPFYLLPSLGGNNTLRGYDDYRFHDRALLLLNVEGRVPMMTHVDAAVFFDAGNVASRIGDLDFDKRSYGAGLRMHAHRLTFARFDIAHGGEGWRALLSLSDPLNLLRLSRQAAAAPFVP